MLLQLVRGWLEYRSWAVDLLLLCYGCMASTSGDWALLIQEVAAGIASDPRALPQCPGREACWHQARNGLIFALFPACVLQAVRQGFHPGSKAWFRCGWHRACFISLAAAVRLRNICAQPRRRLRLLQAWLRRPSGRHLAFSDTLHFGGAGLMADIVSSGCSLIARAEVTIAGLLSPIVVALIGQGLADHVANVDPNHKAGPGIRGRRGSAIHFRRRRSLSPWRFRASARRSAFSASSRSRLASNTRPVGIAWRARAFSSAGAGKLRGITVLHGDHGHPNRAELSMRSGGELYPSGPFSPPTHDVRIAGRMWRCTL